MVKAVNTDTAQKKKTSTQLSTQTGKMVRGHEVRRLPLGEYLRALDAVREMPESVMQACFPEMDAEGMLRFLRGMDKNSLTALIVKMLGVVPREAVKLLAILTGIEEETLLNDPAIGLDGAAEMVEAFWEINGIENFMQAAVRVAAQVKEIRAKAGSKG